MVFIFIPTPNSPNLIACQTQLIYIFRKYQFKSKHLGLGEKKLKERYYSRKQALIVKDKENSGVSNKLIEQTDS